MSAIIIWGDRRDCSVAQAQALLPSPVTVSSAEETLLSCSQGEGLCVCWEEAKQELDMEAFPVHGIHEWPRAFSGQCWRPQGPRGAASSGQPPHAGQALSQSRVTKEVFPSPLSHTTLPAEMRILLHPQQRPPSEPGAEPGAAFPK